MAKRLRRAGGITTFWLSWPLLYWYLKNSHRTRVIIRCHDEILVVRNLLSPGRWMLPGGGVKPGESMQSAACREIAEELGITLNDKECKRITTSEYRQHGLRFTFDLFLVDLKSKIPFIIQRSEIADAEWVPIKSIKNGKYSSDVFTALDALK